MQTEPLKNGSNWKIAAHNLLLTQLCCQTRICHIAEHKSTASWFTVHISSVVWLPVEKYKCKLERLGNRSSGFVLPQNEELLCKPDEAQAVHRRWHA